MKCIRQDKASQAAFLDLEQGYEMRSVRAKDFVAVFEKARNCEQLRKNVQKLHGTMIASLPTAANKPTSSLGTQESLAESLMPMPSPAGQSQPYFPPAPGSNGGSYGNDDLDLDIFDQ
ncbi:MAG: hypothetical protein EOP06_14130 [Proteobacteria bacterium]|nr:MAG: hypothetical protein EOP06_14130 [Pseudomonadota bacterium]